MSVVRKLLTVVGGVALVAAILVGGFIWGSSSSFLDAPVETHEETSTSEIINAVERREEIVLLSTATQGLHTVQKETRIFRWDLPGTRRTNLLQYSFNSKLGIAGRDVKITEIGPDLFRVTIPPFKVIGYIDPEFKTVHREGKVLSFVTEKIDSTEAVMEILDDGKRQEHIELNRELLKDQARNFYTGIIHAIDRDVDLQFEFR